MCPEWPPRRRWKTRQHLRTLPFMGFSGDRRSQGPFRARGARGRLALLLLFALALGPGSPASAGTESAEGKEEVPSLDPSFKATGDHRVVLIMPDDLDPDKLELKQGQLVVWISYARNPSIVVFDREVARDMICHSLVNFSLRDGALRSDPIEPGEFASFCELKPGTYEYRVTQVPSSPDAAVPAPLNGEIDVRATP